MKNEDQRLYWIALATVPRIGIVLYNRLVKHFGSPKKVLEADKKELIQVPKIAEKAAEAVLFKADFKKAEEQVKLLDNSNYNLVTFHSENYPEQLKNIYDPPPFLYYEGDLACLHTPTIGIVGSRSLSVYGKMMAEKMSVELCRAGFTIVSGFARGIDTAAHKAALEAGGKTAAVFGSGLNVIYPPENKTIYRDLVLGGCALSEFFLGQRPEPKHFPRRNRIISGLSLGVVLVEAGVKSGALLTAQHALEQGREVFAVPGNINSKTSAV